jgi:hypothetical protein
MRWFAIVLVLVLSATVGFAQMVSMPVSYGFSNSVIDHNGRVMVLDASYLYPPLLDVQPLAIPIRFPPTVRTHVTVIESDASRKQDAQFEGTFQVVGVGRYAVYAIITNYVVTATPAVQAPTSFTRQLVAIGPAFPTLPSIDVPVQTDVKISAVGDDSAPDTIVFVPVRITPLVAVSTGAVLPVPPIPAQPRAVQMYRSDGKSFTALPPVTIPNP